MDVIIEKWGVRIVVHYSKHSKSIQNVVQKKPRAYKNKIVTPLPPKNPKYPP